MSCCLTSGLKYFKCNEIALLKARGKHSSFRQVENFRFKDEAKRVCFTNLHGVVSIFIIVDVSVGQAHPKASDIKDLDIFNVAFLKCEEKIKGDA